MTARDEMAVLLDRKCWRCGSRPDTDDLDAIASLATNPETAPAVFAWLVEAGVLEQMGWAAFDGDEYHSFYYASRDRPQPSATELLPVYAAPPRSDR